MVREKKEGGEGEGGEGGKKGGRDTVNYTTPQTLYLTELSVTINY